jgi:hypothetical protein
MIDNFALAVSHGLILLAIWSLVGRPDLDEDVPQAQRSSRQKKALPKDHLGA